MKFNTYIMEDALEAIIDYRGKTPQKSESGIPTLSAKTVKNNYIDYSNCYYISQEEYNRFMVRGFPQKGDILLTTEAPLGMVAKLDRDDIAIAQRLLTLRGRENVLDNDYLLYFLQSSTGQHLLKSHETGTTVTGIKQAVFRKLEISIPDIENQRKIATILSSLDRRISLNTAINENLEQQAYLLLEQMLNAPHSDVCCLSDIANINPRYTLSKGTEARYIDMSQLSTTTSFPDGWTFRAYNGGMKFRNQDTIMARITPCLENGKTAYVGFLANDEIAFGSTEYIVLSPKDNTPPELLYCLVRNPDFRSYATVNMNGSSGRQRVSGEIIGKYEIPQFTEDELASFESVTRPLFKQITENSMQNRNLSSIRDTLLPKLMNGEIDVSAVRI